MTQRLTTRGVRTAQAIRDREDFVTRGALKGENVSTGIGLMRWAGRLSGPDADRFFVDQPRIRYVVWSYSTPIAWWCTDIGWHKVSQKFSPTTSKHQGNLYLI